MNRSRSIIVLARGTFACVAALGFVGFVSGCGTSAKQSADLTAKAWSTDQYLAPADPASRSKNAARILSTPERTVSRTMQVGSAAAIIHKSPSLTSPAVGSLKAGDAVTVTVEADFVRIPVTSDMREYIGANGGDTTATWAKVTSGKVEGWVPARALVNPLELATSSESLAGMQPDAATKGFSRKVKFEATAVKGAAGTPKLAGSDYPAAEAVIARLVVPIDVKSAPESGPSGKVKRAAGVAPAGVELSKLDPDLAKQVDAAAAQAKQPPSQKDGGGGGLGGFGSLIPGGDDPKVKLGLEVAGLVKFYTEATPVTASDERVLGRECLAAMLSGAKPLPESSPIAKYVRWVGTRVAANSTSVYPSIGLDFIVLDSEEVNAVAVPGGPIIVTSGMMGFLQNEDELAAILGHEIAHVEERHGLKVAIDQGVTKLPRLLEFAQSQSKGAFEPMVAKMLADAGVPQGLAKEGASQVIDQLNKALADLLPQIVNSIVKEAWKDGDQGVETAADLRGMALACAAGYDPAALDAALERLKAKIGDYGGANYSPERADLERSVLPLLPAAAGAGPAIQEGADGAVTVRTVKPSAAALARWKQMQASLAKS